jgi:NTE family protein
LETNRFLSFKAELTIDTRNMPIGATTGSYTEIFYDYTPSLMGNEIEFSRLFFAHEFNTSFTDWLFGRVRFDFGISDDRTPLAKQFSIGGFGSSYSSAFYGLRMDDFRGRQIMVAGTEVQALLPLQLVVPTLIGIHYNFGNAWEQFGSIRFQEMIHGVGAVLTLRTPIGEARLGFGRPFRLVKIGEESFIRFAPSVYYAAIGYEF